MSHEIQVDVGTADTMYAVIRNAAGQVWYPAGQVFETWGTGGRTAANYAITLTDRGAYRRTGDFDANIPAGRYSVQVRVQAGGSPADGDALASPALTEVLTRQILWSGSGVVTVDKLLANKRRQDKSSGAITYFDDDGATELLSEAPVDTETTITLERSE